VPDKANAQIHPSAAPAAILILNRNGIGDGDVDDKVAGDNT